MLTPSHRDELVCQFVAENLADTLAEAWRKCEDGGEMVRLCGAMLGMEGWPTTREILLVLCECAETTFQYLPKIETRPQACVRASRLWAEGKATIEDVEAAVRVAAGTAGPIAREGVVWFNAAQEVTGPDAAKSVAWAAYSIADATLNAADVDRFVASGDAKSADVWSCAFRCMANVVLFASASAVADAGDARRSAARRKAQSECLKSFADVVRTMETCQRQFGPPREVEILSAVVAGHSRKEVADYFKISEDTIRHHLNNRLDKVPELAEFIKTLGC